MEEYTNAGIFGVLNTYGHGNYERAALLCPCRYVMHYVALPRSFAPLLQIWFQNFEQSRHEITTMTNVQQLRLIRILVTSACEKN